MYAIGFGSFSDRVVRQSFSAESGEEYKHVTVMGHLAMGKEDFACDESLSEAAPSRDFYRC